MASAKLPSTRPKVAMSWAGIKLAMGAAWSPKAEYPRSKEKP